MHQSTNQQRPHRPKEDTLAAAKASYHNTSYVLKDDGSNSKLSQSFVTLAKDFDVRPKRSCCVYPSFNIPEHSNHSEALTGQDEQRSRSDYHELDRAWAMRSQYQHSYSSGLHPQEQSLTNTPMSRWMSEAPVAGPYHNISRVAKNPAAQSSQEAFKTPGTKGSTRSKAGSWGSFDERHR